VVNGQICRCIQSFIHTDNPDGGTDIATLLRRSLAEVCTVRVLLVLSYFITFRVSRRRCEMCYGRTRLYVCMSVCVFVCVSVRGHLPTLLQRPGCNLGSGRGYPLVVHYWADLQSVHGLRCYGNTRNAWQSPAVIRQAHRTPHALRMPAKAPLISDKIDAPAACATLSATTPFHFVHTAGVL